MYGMCVFSPQRPTRTHRFSPQCTFPTMYSLYVQCVCIFPTTTNEDSQIFPTMHFPHNVSFACTVCVYFPHNNQLGRTDFLHNALSPQCIVCTYSVGVFSPQRPTRIHRFSPQCTFRTMYSLHVQYVCVYPTTTN